MIKFFIGAFIGFMLCACLKLSSEADSKDRIDRAVDYIEKNSLYDQDYDYDYEENITEGIVSDERATKELLKILRGEE